MNLIKAIIGLIFLVATSSEVYSQAVLVPVRMARCPIDFAEHPKTVRGIVEQVSADTLIVKESNGTPREVTLVSGTNFYEAKKATLDRIEKGMYVKIINTQNRGDSHPRDRPEAVTIAGSREGEVLNTPQKVNCWHYYPADGSDKSVILTFKDEQDTGVEIVVTPNTNIFTVDKIERAMLQKGSRVYINGEQDYDNYCLKNGKVLTQRVTIDEEEIIPDDVRKGSQKVKKASSSKAVSH
jgi:hypothetical protein